MLVLSSLGCDLFFFLLKIIFFGTQIGWRNKHAIELASSNFPSIKNKLWSCILKNSKTRGIFTVAAFFFSRFCCFCFLYHCDSAQWNVSLCTQWYTWLFLLFFSFLFFFFPLMVFFFLHFSLMNFFWFNLVWNFLFFSFLINFFRLTHRFFFLFSYQIFMTRIPSLTG
jgi:hypothetical protein